VILGNNINGALLGLLARLHVPMILDMHGDMVAELEMLESVSTLSSGVRRLGRHVLYRLADASAVRLSNRISCVSKTMMSVLQDRGVATDRLVYVPNCVDLTLFHPQPQEQSAEIRRRLGIPPESRLFGYLGRFHRWQGVDNFIAAARSIERDDVRFLILGGDHDSTEGSLQFVPQVPVLEMPHYYAACDVVALPRPDHPATRVAAPTKFAEYTAMGRPVLTTDVGDAARLVREYDCGAVAPSNSVEDLRDAILTMAGLDDVRLGTMGAAARQLAETEFSFDVAAHNLASCIEQLVTPREHRSV
jgi:glycosyltransferase involved in cell wall biosynthesis